MCNPALTTGPEAPFLAGRVPKKHLRTQVGGGNGNGSESGVGSGQGESALQGSGPPSQATDAPI